MGTGILKGQIYVQILNMEMQDDGYMNESAECLFSAG